ncbi:hypothetical protein RFI_30187 [Reticulomyxa filosa]|uniref:Flavin-containing monooxygenase n=1 Tax=Reticulomyxa filosa TaxID=46433 RepID=X6M2J4_RETFI|nr:hypothetical protein RFI_30187 [Reticulomyxa filosa]|eukprot:ETO07205.1 hypothetical protein RFI_30187 [Reticulomyxa filosa]
MKELKEQGFKNVTGFESGSDIGGIWDIKNTRSTCWPQLYANISKLNFAYPDFPWQFNPEKELYHASIKEVYDYLHKYATVFKLLDDIQFHSKVLQITPEKVHLTEDGEQKCAQWSMEYVLNGNKKKKRPLIVW